MTRGGLKELEIEDNRLKKLIVDKAIDISILKEANKYSEKHHAPRQGGCRDPRSPDWNTRRARPKAY